MEINKWQKVITKVINKRFPIKFSPEDRIISLASQVGQLGEKIQTLQGTRKWDRRADTPLSEMITAVFIDICILCDIYNIDLDKTLRGDIKWLLTNLEKR